MIISRAILNKRDMTVYDIVESKYPIREMVQEMRNIFDDHSLLPQEYIDEVANTPVFIKTFNKPLKQITTFPFFYKVCKIKFVCSTDDPYLETFKQEVEKSILDAEVVVFDKSDYFKKELMGDDYPFSDDYIRSSVFARHFIDDYAVKNGYRFWMDIDNDLKIILRFPDKKIRKYDIELARFSIGAYLYLLDKYPWVSYLSSSSPGSEAMGQIYIRGYNVNPTNLYFYKKSVSWMGRIVDDVITPVMHLKKYGEIAIALPIINTDQKLITGEMGRTYKYIKNDLEEKGIIKPNNKSEIGELGRWYLEQYFPEEMGEIAKSVLRPVCTLVRKQVEKQL